MDSVHNTQTRAGRPVVAFERNASDASTRLSFEDGSFRDRTARVFTDQHNVFRALSAEALAEWRKTCSLRFFNHLCQNGQVVGTSELPQDDWPENPPVGSWAGILRHQRIPFVTYPYEWSFSMLQDAALLHLEILGESIPEGIILKDSSPYNVQFIGSKPVFIDVASFVSMSFGEPWNGYQQFCEMMLFPLLLQAYRSIDIQPTLRVKLDGISAREFLRPLSWRDMLRPGVMIHGWLQAMLEEKAGQSRTDTIDTLKSSGFDPHLILRNVQKLTRLIRRLSWSPIANVWTGYRRDLPHVVQDGQVKGEFVQNICVTKRRKLVWDLGCNDGHFSKIAAEHADCVIAMDRDHGCVERLYRSVRQEKLPNIVPLCIDLLNPSAALGWRGRERKRLEHRGSPELILCLGLIHHLVIAGNIPLPEVVDWLASLNAEIILEFPSKKDPMVQHLLRNKRDQYSDYSLSALEDAARRCGFRIPRRIDLPSGERTLLMLTPDETTAGIP